MYKSIYISIRIWLAQNGRQNIRVSPLFPFRKGQKVLSRLVKANRLKTQRTHEAEQKKKKKKKNTSHVDMKFGKRGQYSLAKGCGLGLIYEMNKMKNHLFFFFAVFQDNGSVKSMYSQLTSSFTR